LLGFNWFNKHPQSNEWVRDMYTRTPQMFRHLNRIPAFEDLWDWINVFAEERRLHVGWLSAIDMRHPEPHTVIASKREWIKTHIDPKSVDHA
jgi:hypothetical protein